ncbi:M24 family metallopeptidase [Micromonospora echinofusca]|uniref:M24 family metallopeptidase n=1 Tax=Micromonospora echinofusca TaxID=47858 RepID=A0ABS3VK11_MICEH|nr:Xaa-Pro peptidase family protein [Micromonospora echinofusca]MBO4204860.1 M24 family metallopeptidase [Micromonospora echinofusca]
MRLPDTFYTTVRARLNEALAEQELDGFLATAPADVAFLSGFFYIATERPVYLWMPRQGDPLLVIPRLDEEYAAQQGVRISTVSYFEYPGVVSAEETLALALSGRRTRRIGVSAGISVGTLEKLSRAVGGTRLVTTDAVARLRLCKFPEEIPLHEAAARICDEMLAAGRDLIAEALAAGTALPREDEIARHVIGYGTDRMYAEYDLVVYTTKLAGGLVYAGPNSALPHGLPTRRRIQPGDTLILSLGAAVASRFVESERTFVVGEPTAEQQRYHEADREAQQVGTEAMVVGRTCAEVNRTCLDVLRGHGLGDYIRHRQGHGIGLQNHEPPWVEDGDDTVLAPGMLLSSEPGVYVPGHAGYRISDTVLVTADGPRRLTGFPRDLESTIIEGVR